MEFQYPRAMHELMEHLKNLPGVGRRTAERMALEVYHWEHSRTADLAEVLRTLHERVGTCRECGNLADADAPDGSGLCMICSSPARDRTSVCIVEDSSRIRVIEAAGVFHGVYHVLGGRIAPLEGKTADQLSIPALCERIGRNGVREVILALSPDVEGQATSIYIARLLKKMDLRVSRLARGLPAGSDLSYADPATIAIALNARVGLDEGSSEP